MILKSLEMQGFKSFPDKTVLNFNKGVTAVVGPNGSGKSNISDAVRWVLGEQSTKNLRGSKMEDVVFMGTEERKAKGFAEVTLRFDNTDRALSNDADEVSITRRYFRSGESEYLINGKTARLRDVNELFMDTGLGRDGYSIVGQGKIADMVSSKAGERREMLEEAAGISHFRYRRNDANKRLAAAEENLLRLRDILTELEGRVKPLKVQSEKAQKFLVLAEERKTLQIGKWLHEIDKTSQRLREQEHKIATAEVAKQEVDAATEHIVAAMDKAGEDIQKLNIEIEEVRRASSQYEEQASALETQIGVAENSILHNNEAIERLKKDQSSEDETEQHLEERIKEAEKNAEEKKTAQEALRAELSGLLAEQKEKESSSLRYNEESAALSATLSAASVELAQHKVTVDTAAENLRELDEKEETLKASYEQRQAAFADSESKKNEVETALNECKDLIARTQNAIDGYSIRFHSRSKKAEEVKQALEEKKREIYKLEDRHRLLSDMEKNMEGYGGAVKAVMKEAARGALRGIHGPLSQLISVPHDYAVAVETALGAAIQNIVTDNENDAKAAVYFLKNAHAGRATFLPIRAIRGKSLQENGLSDQYGFVSVAADLISCDNQYREIINAQLGRTVVAEDMDAAVAIAKKYNYRFRIVTLDGQLVNAGGSITGGSRGKGAGILSRTNEIEQILETIDRAKKEYAGLSSDYVSLAESFAAAKADLDGAQGDLLRANEEKIRLEGELRLLSEQWNVATESLQSIESEKNSIAQKRAAVIQNTENAKQRIAVLEAQTAENEEKMRRMNADRDALLSLRETLSGKATELNLELLSLSKDEAAAREEMEHLRSRQMHHTDKKSSLLAEIESYEQKNAGLRADIASLKETSEKLRSGAGDARGNIDALLEQRDELLKKTNELRNTEREKLGEKEKYAGELARLEEQSKTAQANYENLNAKLFEEYNLTKAEAEQLNIEIEDYAAADRRLQELKAAIRSLGSVNVSAIEEYKEVSERYTFMAEQIGDVENSRDELLKLIAELTQKMGMQFKEKFDLINRAFGETFKELFGGGHAELLLSDEKEILESDIEIKVQPPGKHLKSIEPLSGGEKGLAAISLLFAILKITPAPFCIFDEVEAALDDVNVARYAQYVRRMADNTQFVLITHRRGTMEEADVLYGVTMQESGVSKLLELKTAEMAKKLGLA